MEYIYRLSMKWSNKDPDTNETETMTIEPKDVSFLVMENDYENKLMPTLFAKLNMDKKKIDKIIKNAKTAEIYLGIFKEQKTEDPVRDVTVKPKLTTQYIGTMSYFIKKDINYNKEIDYPENATEGDTAGSSDKNKEIRESFSIGLMFKNCIQWNKQTANNTFINSTPFNSVLSFFAGIPILIEPFQYNDQFGQLIVPPQDSLYNAVKFFNDYKVFYDTPFRFYIEPDCVYLVSSSGEATKKKGETYDTVIFNIRTVTDSLSLIKGVEELEDLSCYYCDVQIKDSVYNIDNDTGKMYNEIVTIIDPGKDNTITCLDSVSDALNKVSTATNEITSKITKKIDSISPIPSDLYSFKGIFIDSAASHTLACTNISDDIDEAISIIKRSQSTGNSSESGGVNKETVDEYVKLLTEYNSQILSNASKVSSLPSLYNKTTDLLNSAIAGVTNIPSLINSISSVSASDNISSMVNRAIKIKDQAVEHFTSVNNTLMPLVDCASICHANSINAANAIIAFAGFVGTSDESSSDSSEKLVQLATDIKTNAVILEQEAETIETNLTKYRGYSSLVQGLTSTVQTQINGLVSKVNNIKSTITRSISGVATTVNNSIKSIDRIIKNTKSIYSAAKSLDFNINDLATLQKDISIINDISKIGLLGISKFDIDLNLYGGTDINGKKIIRVSNDNANLVKNEKAKIENKLNQLSFSIENIDTSIITPNKRYVIGNYSGHQDKDGVFLLQRKIDIFTRHGDDEFYCNTQLDFDKIADAVSSGASESSKSNSTSNKKNKTNILKIVKEAENIFKKSKNISSINDARSILSSAESIYKEVKKSK